MSTTTSPPSASDRLLQRLDWQVIRRLDGLLQGDYRSLFYGNGLDFADLREYQAEDDVRHIDWNVTARMDTPYVRKYHEDREITAWFLLDLSPSVDFGARDHQKRNTTLEFVTVMSRLLTRHGNRVGAILFTGQNAKPEKNIPVGSGRLHVLRLINDIRTLPRPKRAAFTDLKPLMMSGLNTIRRRSLVIVVSDFISAPGWEQPLAGLTRRHDVVAVRVFDPREQSLPDVGVITLEDSETGEQVIVDTRDKRFRKRFEESARKREAALTASFKQAGVEAFPLSTEDDLVRTLVGFVGARKRTRRKAVSA
jgi:uncharacterized protein (DUF58 family)